MPPILDIRAYFLDEFDDADAYPPMPPDYGTGQSFDPNNNEADEEKLAKIIEWFKLFVGWIQWLQWKNHGGLLDMNQEGFKGEVSDKDKIKMKKWAHGSFMRDRYWWCIKYLQAKEGGDFSLFSNNSFENA